MNFNHWEWISSYTVVLCMTYHIITEDALLQTYSIALVLNMTWQIFHAHHTKRTPNVTSSLCLLDLPGICGCRWRDFSSCSGVVVGCCGEGFSGFVDFRRGRDSCKPLKGAEIHLGRVVEADVGDSNAVFTHRKPTEGWNTEHNIRRTSKHRNVTEELVRFTSD